VPGRQPTEHAEQARGIR